MDLVLAKNAGFCFGVKRAIDKAFEILSTGEKKIYSIGSLIHNEQVVNDLKNKGLIELTDEESVKNIKNETVIIRTHGIEKHLYNIIEKNGNNIIDLTCPFVKRIHNIVSEYTDKGYTIIVIGDAAHPEVKGIISYGKDIYVVNSQDDIDKLNIDRDEPVLIVFQTTTNASKAQKLVDILRKFYYNSIVIDTICNTTKERQDEVIDLAKILDVMLIIGSNSSSNTKKLYEESKRYCDKSYIISSVDDLKKIYLSEKSKVGISAGASTPQYLIEEILKNVRNEF